MGVVRQADGRVFELVDAPTQRVTWVRTLTDLDLLSAGAAHEQLVALCATGSSATGWGADGVGPPSGWLVVELVPACFVDLRGLRMLIELGRVRREQGRSTLLISPMRRMARVLQILQPDGGLVLVPTVQDARREVHGAR